MICFQHMLSIDLNCDMGEGMETDAGLMPYISSANIACGFHAGYAQIMHHTVALCKNYGLAVGAHPGYNDKENFGRKPIPLSAHEIEVLLQQQVDALQHICTQLSVPLHHIKLHGVLYNMVSADAALAKQVADILYKLYPNIMVYALSGSHFMQACLQKQLPVSAEVFADRTYTNAGLLTPRTQPNALIHTTSESLQQVLRFIQEKAVITTSGKKIAIAADTICLHGDGAHAVAFAKTIHETLQQLGIGIQTL
jgi:UPF0271 protein